MARETRKEPVERAVPTAVHTPAVASCQQSQWAERDLGTGQFGE
jgi:hypothetical protein